MKLWKLSQTTNTGYDTYDSAIVAAETKEAAVCTHPSEYACAGWGELDGRHCWRGRYDAPHKPHLHGKLYEYGNGCWPHPADVVVELIGEALPGTQPGVICASFNAG